MGGNISFSGLSGFDAQAIVEQLIQIKRQPIKAYEDQQLIINSKRSVFSDLRTKLSSLQSTVSSINREQNLSVKTATSSDDSVATASATSFAEQGEFTLSNISLATKSSEAFTAASDQSAQFSAGSFFEFEVNGTTYNIDVSALDAEDQSLEGLRDAINDQAGDDVRAIIINTGDANDPYKLVLQSNETGTDNQISNISTDITVTTSSGDTALAALADDRVIADNASFKLNGVTVSRSSNTIDDLVEGVTIKLKEATTGSVDISVARDNTAVKSKIETFVSQYNEVNSVIQKQFEIDPETGFAGILSGDSSLRRIQSSLQQLVVGGVSDADGNRFSLGTLGISIDRDTGNLSFDSAKYDNAVAENPDIALDLLLNRGTTTSNDFSFSSATENTTAGTFAVSVSGYDTNGNVQGTFTYDGQVYTGTGDGQLLTGPKGSPAEGLKVRIDEGATGSLGDIYVSIGVAEKMEATLRSFVSPLVGLLPKLDSRLQSDYELLSDQIDAFELRLDNEERILTQQFLAAEEAISQLQSQQSAFTQQLSQL